MKAINPENRMKQLKLFSMLLFLLAAVATYSQESSSLQGNPTNTSLNAVLSTKLMAELSKVTPDQFEPNTIISFSFPNSTNVQLAVYDKYGREIKMLINETRNGGSYGADLNQANLKGGLYYYRLTVGNDTQVRKICILN